MEIEILNFICRILKIRNRRLLLLALLPGMLFAFLSCSKKPTVETTPWGTTVGEDTTLQSSGYSLSDIQTNGELIVLTLSGPETYYDYRGHGMGLQYLLCDQFAQHLGVSLRVEVCKDTLDMVRRLKKGDGDIIAFQLPKKIKGITFAGAGVDSLNTKWAVRDDSRELADTLNSWFRPEMIAKMRKEEAFLLSTRSITRHVYSPFLDRSTGTISRYDHLFKRYAPLARWDWRLLAAQCYQESTFDPRAHSWAGACGLMQIMPGTADHLGLPRGEMYDPERNVAAAAKYIQELSGHFRDVPASERIYYVLASYNGGYFHIRDAMALAQKHGRDPHRWGDVQEFILKLSSAAYYRDPVVKHGYMRGTETVNYVENIRARWTQYRGGARGSIGGGSGVFFTTPQRSKHGNRFHV